MAKPRFHPDRALTGAERTARWRAKQPKPPPKAPKPDPLPWLKSCAQLAGGDFLPSPMLAEKPPERSRFDAAAMIAGTVHFPDGRWRWY
jgi:hypothetical protein